MNKPLNWAEAISMCHQGKQGFVLATVLETKGSTQEIAAPKWSSPKTLFLTPSAVASSTASIDAAREALKLKVKTQQLEHFPLAGKAQQCCGGSVAVLLETFPVARLAVTIFGAGHIGRALVQVLEQCDSRVQWVDSRSERFPAGLAGNVKAIPMDEPESMIASLAPEEKVVIVTHDHALDLRLLHQLLDETALASIGLIGSETKASRFKSQLRALGVPASEDWRWRCPVGLPR